MAIADQLAELNTLRENLATAINGNGVDASTAEGLSSLVQKTGQVVDMLNAVIDRSVEKVYSLNATSIGISAFYYCTALTSVDLPAATSIGNYAFYFCTSLTSVYLPVATSIGNYAFIYCTALDTLILRKSDTICTLSNTNALASTPIASGTGYIYVPAALVDSYKAATNWTKYADQIRAIEDYPEICGGAV